MVRSVVLLLLGIAVLPADTRGQEGLAGSARSVQRALAGREMAALRVRLRPTGVLLHLHGESHVELAPAQAVAALRDFFAEHEDGRFTMGRVASSEGDAGRGFTEVEWDTVVRGTSESVRYQLYAGLAWSEDRWWIDELRVLPLGGRFRH